MRLQVQGLLSGLDLFRPAGKIRPSMSACKTDINFSRYILNLHIVQVS